MKQLLRTQLAGVRTLALDGALQRVAVAVGVRGASLHTNLALGSALMNLHGSRLMNLYPSLPGSADV